ncbi:MAG: hypothetical protein GYB49_06025 [Alphaproteobacteria bacterium]|nr:hypothetical protein [Alphaproteobacteria bacterium]
MAWLLAHIWAALAGAAVFGLLLGWSIRGMLLVGKMRRATVERDITMTELEQAKDEIERLYAAQRGKPIGGGEVNVREELAEREVKISRLANELERAKKQLEDLKDRPEPAKAAASLAPRSMSEAVASDPAPALVWRNRHLESRVRHLEGLIEQGVAAAPAVQEAPQAALMSGADADPTEVGLAADAAPEAGAEAAKEEWQVGFLRQRVEALEEQLIKAESEAKQALEAAEAAKSEAAAQPAETPAPAASAHTPREGEIEEELARLRWRNRFLEGRLAYFEGDAREEVEAETAATVEAEEEPVETLPAEAMPEERPNFSFQGDEPVSDEEPPVAIAPAFGALEEVTPAEEELPAEEAEADTADQDMADLEEVDLEDDAADEAEPEEDTPASESEEDYMTVADVYEDTVGTDAGEEVSGEEEDESSDTADEPEDDETPLASSEEASRAILAALELDDEDEADDDAAEEYDAESEDELDDDAEVEETEAEEDQDDEEAYDEDSDDDEDYDDAEEDEDFDEDDESYEDEDESDDDEDYESDDDEEDDDESSYDEEDDEDDYEEEDEDFDEEDEDEDFDEDEDDESEYDDEDEDDESDLDADDALDDEDDESEELSDEEEGEDLYAEDDSDEVGDEQDEDVYAEAEEESDLDEGDFEEDDSEDGDFEDDAPVGIAPSALDKPVAGHADDLTVIGGIGPKIQELLNGMGIWHYEQIAAWTPDNIAWVDRELNFSGRIVREGWVEQAAILAGDMAEEDA